ncbi:MULTISPECIES: sulfurtransferase [Halorussus]|uniref:sulfurtransferase n=1 Tax=Halorussus TaxID=1070314 RepID=UPI00209FCF0A|nr:sulfurtransferase [Halorussus vallis]USZ74434.1 sulfurtransferase [Halorussus vallis]
MQENVVVSADWLADRLGEVAVVDVRDAWEYEGIGHVPTAVNVPFDTFRSAEESDEGMLPGAERWAELLGDAGIENDDTIVAYDDTHGVFAARFLVTAELYGHEDLRLLDGDFSSWTREHETTTDVPDPEPTAYEVREPAASPLVDREAVEVAVDAPDDDTVIVDTRTPEEFAAGHVPGAVNLDWKELVDDDSRGLKPREELEAILSDRGITPDRRVLLYCNTARRISHTYVVLSFLGYDDLAFYEGSLTEWEAVGGPIETGS